MSTALSPDKWDGSKQVGTYVHARRDCTERGKRAELEPNPKQQLHIDMAWLETCYGQKAIKACVMAIHATPSQCPHKHYGSGHT